MLYNTALGKYYTTSTGYQLPPLASTTHTGDSCYFHGVIISPGSSFSQILPKLVLGTIIEPRATVDTLEAYSKATTDSCTCCTLPKRCPAETPGRSLKSNLCTLGIQYACVAESVPAKGDRCLFRIHLLREGKLQSLEQVPFSNSGKDTQTGCNSACDCLSVCCLV